MINLQAQEVNLDAGIDFESKEPLFVSLGSFCGPALSIQTAGLRKAAFPLDWVLSVNGEKVIEMLEDNFCHFFDMNSLKPFVTGILLQKHYHIEFSHEGDFSGVKFHHNIPIFFNKYQRRIERFRKLNQYKGKVFFIRSAWPLSVHPNYAFSDPGNLEINEDFSKRLYAALQKFFPNLDLHLIILNTAQEDEIAPPKIIDKIVIFKNPTPNFKEIAELYTN